MYDKWMDKIDLKTDDRAIKLPTYKSKMIIGDIYSNVTIMTAKKFNKIQKKMWKIFFNVDIEDVEVKQNEH